MHLNTAQDLNSLLAFFQSSNLITIKNGVIKTTSLFAKQFIVAADGSIYLLSDVIKYLKETPKHEINSSRLSFCIGQGTSLYTLPPSAKVESVTLAQIQEDPSLIEQLHNVPNVSSLFSSLNSQAYTGKPFSTTDRNQLKYFFNGNQEFLDNINYSTSHIETFISNIKNSSENNMLLLEVKGENVLSTVHRDILKIKLMQQIPLKFRLQKELKFTHNPEAKKQLSQWIDAIDAENAAIKTFLKKAIEGVKTHKKMMERARERYTKLIADDPNFEKKNEIAAKQKEAKELLDNIVNWQFALMTIGSTCYAIGFACYVLGVIIICTIPPLIALSFAISVLDLLFNITIIVPIVSLLILPEAFISSAVLLISSMVLGGVGILAISLLCSIIFNDYSKYGDSCDVVMGCIMYGKHKQYEELLKDMVELQKDNTFRTQFKLNTPEFLANGTEQDVILEQLENDLVEIDALEAEETSKMKCIEVQQTRVKASDIGLFTQSRNANNTEFRPEEAGAITTAQGAFLF